MKYLIVLLFCVVSVWCDTAQIVFQESEKLDQHKIECIAQTGVSRDAVVKTRKHLKLTDDPKLPAYLVCDWKKRGWMAQNGALQWDNIETGIALMGEENVKLPKAKAKEFGHFAKTECSSTPETDNKEQTAVACATCLTEKMKGWLNTHKH